MRLLIPEGFCTGADGSPCHVGKDFFQSGASWKAEPGILSQQPGVESRGKVSKTEGRKGRAWMCCCGQSPLRAPGHRKRQKALRWDQSGDRA